uniref:NADH-ubiquinone oxidoreductase chain 5 n=1 Tax=Tetragnatha nitens TaxID=545214 RepID=A0A0N7BWK3_9ARAC|nr:NADH dehydrogenase subunit 5 [Tetragnatha nitens]AKG65087.1 NADH dehydrogenase subunit 5 [Tetragnatha nitens]
MKLMSIMILLVSCPLIYFALQMLNHSTFISMDIPFFMNDFWEFKISLIMDWTSCLFSSIVMFITSMILMYSMTYMPKKDHKQFMLIMMMFVLSMILLINSNNLVFMLLGWDGLGISSYILVIMYQNPKSGSSGSITILSNRVGDALIIVSIAMMMMSASWSFFPILMNPKFIFILIMLASCTKSAQFPFSAWLPAAMAAPTPISALVHSSTLVTAGVFLMIRVTQFSMMEPLIILMVLSSATAVYASMTACWEQDMKKIIAYSTLSQIAMMMFSISLNNFSVAYFHMITHAMFKSMMFMTAGIIIMNSSYQDMRHMGNMMKNTPSISMSMGISLLALSGLPFMSGFFSKDMILEMMLKSFFTQIMSILMISSVGMTISYSLRMAKFTFLMILKSKKDYFIKSHNTMDIPLMFMTPMSVMLGSILTWMMFPLQMCLLPPYLKLSILFTLVMSIFISLNLNFLSKKFIKMGFSAISIWFIHFMSSILPNKPSNTMFKILSFDKNWQEMYGPHDMFYFIKNNSFKYYMITNTPMFILMLIMIPIFIIMMM